MTPTDIEKLHSLYNALTGFNLSMQYDRERSWYEFSRAGFSAEDLRLVLTHLMRGIRAKKRNMGCLKFTNLIQSPDSFELELAEAKAYLRNTGPPTAQEKALASLRPRACEPVLTVNCKPAKEVMKKLIEQMRREVDL